MQILVTGGAGYIGSILTPRLLAAGHSVTVLDNFMYGQTPLLDVCADPNLEIVRGDARDREAVSRLIRTADVIVPLACLTGAPLCARDPWAAQTTNLDAVKLVMELKSRQQRVLFPTTNSGYGIGQKGVPCTEESPLKPISLYGRLKVDAEKAVLDGENTLTFRLATVFGTSPRMRLDLLVNDFVWRALHDGFLVLFEAHFKRNYVHVRDVARAFLHALDRFESMKGQAYNVGLSDANLSKLELCQEIRKALPKFVFMEAKVGEDPDKRDYVVSNDKIERAGFRPDHPLQAGIRELVKGFQILPKGDFRNA